MKITKHVRKYAAEQGIGQEEALGQGLSQKAAEFRRIELHGAAQETAPR